MSKLRKSKTISKPLSRVRVFKKLRFQAVPRSFVFQGKKNQWVYSFGLGKAQGAASDKAFLGGKGANLHEMTRLKIPVPPGFTLSTDVCTFYHHQEAFPRPLIDQVKKALKRLERQRKRSFGKGPSPLLVSVRSGAPISMPGMMDTILNLGLNEKTVPFLAKESGNARFAWDSYRRLIAMYGEVVLGIAGHHFESLLELLKEEKGVQTDTELSGKDLQQLCQSFLNLIEIEGKAFPQDPWDQLWGAIEAVFCSWSNPRAITYRKLHHISETLGTAVNVQSMVFGNQGNDCATGVCFTRDPSTGEKCFFGEYLLNAQGEDVVAGIRTPAPLNKTSRSSQNKHAVSLQEALPKTYQTLVRVYKKLEHHYRDMQDIEFTIEHKTLYILQTRNGKRTAQAAVRMAVEMVRERLISKKEAVLRLDPEQVHQLLHPGLDPKSKKELLAQGLPASPGAASGKIVFDSERAKVLCEQGENVILVRTETSPEDIQGMSVAKGILTARGGMTSHAAVVARGMGRACIVGCSELKISTQRRELCIGKNVFPEGTWITLDGSTGKVFFGKIPMVASQTNIYFQTLLKWADEYRRLKIRTNADTVADAKQARIFGAEGIGLCRTEHMFFAPERIQAVREMILSKSEEGRIRALAKILPMQKSDFKGLFKIMHGLPVTIRLLDPPLHEFLPQTQKEQTGLAQMLGLSLEKLQERIDQLRELNPMLGHRGCRLGISYPEIYRTQVRAIFEAACELFLEKNIKISPEVMIPLVGHVRELATIKCFCEDEIQKVIRHYQAQSKRKKIRLSYQIGTMIELPRAALTADQIAQEAEFFSFGTNDLTQTTLGLSRDDSASFLKDYLDQNIYQTDPFAQIDTEGVGALVRIAVEKGKQTHPKIKLGICGEHGGNPKSIDFFESVGLHYVSCSPFRVPIARLAAAQAVLKKETTKKSRKTKSRKKRSKKRS